MNRTRTFARRGDHQLEAALAGGDAPALGGLTYSMPTAFTRAAADRKRTEVRKADKSTHHCKGRQRRPSDCSYPFEKTRLGLAGRLHQLAH